MLRELCLDPLGLTVTEAAGALGVSRKTLSGIVNGRAGYQPRNGRPAVPGIRDDCPESWMNQQVHAKRLHSRVSRCWSSGH